jgi:hypothetical protein
LFWVGSGGGGGGCVCLLIARVAFEDGEQYLSLLYLKFY